MFSLKIDISVKIQKFYKEKVKVLLGRNKSFVKR